MTPPVVPWKLYFGHIETKFDPNNGDIHHFLAHGSGRAPIVHGRVIVNMAIENERCIDETEICIDFVCASETDFLADIFCDLHSNHNSGPSQLLAVKLLQNHDST